MIQKFRFYHLKLNSMFEVVSINFLNEKVECIVSEVDNYLNTWRWSYGELLRSTGLFDKNGKLIYEGDILSVSKNHNKTDSRVFNDEKVNYRVEFLNYDDMEAYADIEHYGWCATGSIDKWSTRCTLIDAVKLWDAEILGNIYEHPHLLEEE